MLRKLMKHELRATGRTMLPLYLIVLVLSLGMNSALRGVFNNTPYQVLNILGSIFTTAFFIAIAAVCVMSIVVMVRRFYKNLLRDEGYVMLTLPVSVHQQVWSKLIVSAVWFAATVLVVIAAACIATFDVNVWNTNVDYILHFFRDMLSEYAIDVAAFAVELLVLCFLFCCAVCLHFYAALAVGHSFAGHKMAWSVLFFFVFQFAEQFLISAVIVFGDTTGLDYFLTQHIWMNGATGMHLTMLLLCLYTTLYGTVFYLVTTYFLKNRLNLE